MIHIKRIKYIGIVFIILMMVYVIVMGKLGYKLAFHFFDILGKEDTVFALLILALVGWIFILNLIQYKGKYLIAQITVLLVISFTVFTGYIFINFWGDERIMIHETPNDKELLFYSEYQGGGLHHPYYKTTVYQKVAPFTYQELDVIENMDSFLQSVTIEYDNWFNIEYQRFGFTVYMFDYEDGERIDTTQYFEYVK